MIDAFFRRALDLFASLLGLLLLSPIMLLLALAVKISSPGPILFKHERVGKDGKHFKVLKFRSMRISGGVGVTARKDNRITPVGRFLRATKLDELPQLINVLLGEMALVGPRPEIPELVATYSPELRKLLSVRPGITSPASVLLRREEEEIPDGIDVLKYHEEVLVPKKGRIDLEYLGRRTVLTDVLVVLNTFIPVKAK